MYAPTEDFEFESDSTLCPHVVAKEDLGLGEKRMIVVRPRHFTEVCNLVRQTCSEKHVISQHHRWLPISQ